MGERRDEHASVAAVAIQSQSDASRGGFSGRMHGRVDAGKWERVNPAWHIDDELAGNDELLY